MMSETKEIDVSRQHGAWSNRVGARVVVAACLAGALLLPSSAMAAGAEAECVSTWRSIGKLWDQYGDQIKRLVAQIAAGEDGDAEKIKADLDELETKSRGYKEKVGTYLGDSPLQTGPRPLSSKKRSAVTTHQRTWVSGMITRDRVSVLLDGEGGMAPRAKIAVCTVDEKGKYKLVTTRTVQKGDFNRDIKIAVPDAFGKMVSVLVSKQGGIGLNGYRYKISLGEKSSKSETAGTLARPSSTCGHGKSPRHCRNNSGTKTPAGS